MLNDSTEPSIYKLSSRVPRFFLPGHGRIFLLIVRIQTVYAVPLPTFFHFFEKSCLFHLNLFFHKKQFFFDLLSCRLFLLYHESRWRTSVLSCFFAIHLPPVEEGEFLLYIMLNIPIPAMIVNRCLLYVFVRVELRFPLYLPSTAVLGTAFAIFPICRLPLRYTCDHISFFSHL